MRKVNVPTLDCVRLRRIVFYLFGVIYWHIIHKCILMIYDKLVTDGIPEIIGAKCEASSFHVGNKE